MSVYRHRKSPYWQFDFQIKGYRFSGSTEVGTARPRAEAEAVEKIERRAAERLVGEIADTGRRPLTFAACADRWWTEHGQHLREPDLAAAIAWLKGQIGATTRLHEITDDMVARLVAARRQHGRRAGTDAKGNPLYRPIAPRTVNRTVTFLLRRILRRAAANWNAILLREPKWRAHVLKEPRRPIAELTATAEARLDATERTDYAALRRFALITGLRRRELLLTWSQVDFAAGVVRMIAKGGLPRTLPLSRDAYALLWAQRGHHPEFVWTFVATRTRVCPRTGRRYTKGRRYPITYWGLGSHKMRAWAKAGVEGRFHDLRHTAGRRTTRANGNLKLTQALLGHSDIKTTANFYEDVLVEDLRAAMEVTAADQESRKKSQSKVLAPSKALNAKS
ncbi:MAG: site-specific integrase [Xanthobacteraceae bacterium]|nr:MAG: site-specific integrase [Xanthobacteraceae bacterium]